MSRNSSAHWLAAFLILTVLVSGCSTTVISQATMQEVTATLTLESLQRNINAAIGRTVLLGGDIIDTRNNAESTELIILGRPLDSRQRPIATSASPGRFIVLQPSFLDPAIYRAGRRITVAGTVMGQKTLPLGETTYAYPLIENRELFLWPEDGRPYQEPAVHFGVGIGIGL